MDYYSASVCSISPILISSSARVKQNEVEFTEIVVGSFFRSWLISELKFKFEITQAKT